MHSSLKNGRTGFVAFAVAAVAVVGMACGGSAGSREPAEENSTANAEVAPPAQQESNLPAAILGQAGPPRGGAVHYVPDDPSTTGYLVVPEGEGPFPAVILIHEWNGLVDRVRQVADALADEGYVALAADMYGGRTGSNRDENVALMEEAQGDPARMIANLDAAARSLRERPDVTGKVATMGWCFGGGVAPELCHRRRESRRDRHLLRSPGGGSAAAVEPRSPDLRDVRGDGQRNPARAGRAVRWSPARCGNRQRHPYLR